MLISELQAQLEEFKKEYGDIQVMDQEDGELACEQDTTPSDPEDEDSDEVNVIRIY